MRQWIKQLNRQHSIENLFLHTSQHDKLGDTNRPHSWHEFDWMLHCNKRHKNGKGHLKFDSMIYSRNKQIQFIWLTFQYPSFHWVVFCHRFHPNESRHQMLTHRTKVNGIRANNRTVHWCVSCVFYVMQLNNIPIFLVHIIWFPWFLQCNKFNAGKM